MALWKRADMQVQQLSTLLLQLGAQGWQDSVQWAKSGARLVVIPGHLGQRLQCSQRALCLALPAADLPQQALHLHSSRSIASPELAGALCSLHGY